MQIHLKSSSLCLPQAYLCAAFMLIEHGEAEPQTWFGVHSFRRYVLEIRRSHSSAIISPSRIDEWFSILISHPPATSRRKYFDFLDPQRRFGISLSTMVHIYFLFAFIGLVIAQQECYFGPGASNRGPSNLVPCGSTGISTCCLLGDTCLSGNACFNYATGVTYQYGCSDITYKDPSCPFKCGVDTGMSCPFLWTHTI
jgi:hypothetical protein